MHRARAVVLANSGDGMLFDLRPLRFFEMVLVRPASMSVMEQAFGDTGRPVLTHYAEGQSGTSELLLYVLKPNLNLFERMKIRQHKCLCGN
jgi:protein tyrosine phosphatase (PTP) superfamily phosphohydrolase (DUF442 family)